MQMLFPSVDRQVLAFVYDSLARFAVPCFVMIFGTFILDNPRNSNYREFYRKSFRHVGVQTIMFTVLYTSINIVMNLIDGDLGVEEILIGIVAGKPYFRMWYLYMLVGVYVLAPRVLRLKMKSGRSRLENSRLCSWRLGA